MNFIFHPFLKVLIRSQRNFSKINSIYNVIFGIQNSNLMDIDFNKNDDKMRLLISQMEQRLQKIYLGGGKSRIDKLHEQGKMSARERIDFLLDKNTPRFEMGAFAGYEMYP